MLTQEQVATRNLILAAQDVVLVQVAQDIPGSDLQRVVRDAWTSASVGSRYIVDYSYMHMETSPAWGALNRVDDRVEEI